MRRTTGLSILLGILLGGFFGGAVWFTYRNFLDTTGSLVGSSTYVATFVDTNQVFFGKVASMSRGYIVMEDVYYLQQDPNDPAGFILQKSGSELHKPKDEMHLNRDHVLLIQPLEEDSQVVATIKEFEEQQRAAQE